MSSGMRTSNYLLDALDLLTLGTMSSTIDRCKWKTEKLASSLRESYEDYEGEYNNETVHKDAKKIIDALLELISPANPNNLNNPTLHNNHELQSIRNSLEKLNTNLNDFAQNPEYLIHLISEPNKRSQEILSQAEATAPTEESKEALKKALEKYHKNNEQFQENLKLTSELAQMERNIILALSKQYPDTSFIDNDNENNMAVILDAGEALDPIKLKKLKNLFLDENGNPVPLQTLTGLVCQYDQQNDILTLTMPSRILGVFYHTSPDNKRIADFEFLAKSHRALLASKGKLTENTAFHLTIGKTSKYVSSQQQHHPLPKFEQTKCIEAFQGALNAGYPLKKITLNIHGREINIKNIMQELRLDHAAINSMESKSKTQTTQEKFQEKFADTMAKLRKKYEMPEPNAPRSAPRNTP